MRCIIYGHIWDIRTSDSPHCRGLKFRYCTVCGKTETLDGNPIEQNEATALSTLSSSRDGKAPLSDRPDSGRFGKSSTSRGPGGSDDRASDDGARLHL